MVSENASENAKKKAKQRGPPSSRGDGPKADYYSDEDDAADRAEALGIHVDDNGNEIDEPYHKHEHGGEEYYMPGDTHDDYEAADAFDFSNIGQPTTDTDTYGQMSLSIPDKGEDYENFMMTLVRIIDHELVVVDQDGLKDNASLYIETGDEDDNDSNTKIHAAGQEVTIGEVSEDDYHILSNSDTNKMSGSLKLDENNIEDAGDVTIQGSLKLPNSGISED